MQNQILVINPGATSTKIAVFAGETLKFQKNVEHQGVELEAFPTVFEQYPYRLQLIVEALAENGIALESLVAVVGRGGLLKPLLGGTYAVNERMVSDLQKAEQGEHASNLGAVLADVLARQLGIPAFIVDPVSVDEMDPVARISGLPDLDRISMVHALNMKAVARKVAQELGKKYSEVNFVIAHLGTGISIAPHKRGRMIDVDNGMEDGSFSADRCGGLPATQLMKLCYSGKYTFAEMKAKLSRTGGIYAYLGTRDIRVVEQQIAQGNEQAELILSALAYQVAKEIGAMAAVLAGEVDRIILTGGMAHSARIVADISRRVQFIAPLVVVPGEEEMESLAMGGLRVLQGEEAARKYQ